MRVLYFRILFWGLLALGTLLFVGFVHSVQSLISCGNGCGILYIILVPASLGIFVGSLYSFGGALALWLNRRKQKGRPSSQEEQLLEEPVQSKRSHLVIIMLVIAYIIYFVYSIVSPGLKIIFSENMNTDNNIDVQVKSE